MLRPFLLIGVGGSGGKTLRVVRDDLERRLEQAGWTGGLPQAWQFVHIDVPTVADGNERDLPQQLPERDYHGLVGQGIDYRTIDAALVSQPGAHLPDALGGWRPDPDRVNIPASKGAGQYRALGRIITLAGLARVNEALRTARRQLTGAEAVGELQQVTTKLGGQPSATMSEPVVIVVSSIAGGSGSGAVIDVCDAVRALGDKWADQSVGLLYAPDVFDYLPEEARRGVRPNSLAALSELMNGYWSSDGASEGTTELFARYGVSVAAGRRLGPRYPFLVGARNEYVTYRTQNDIYRAMGRSVAAWVASPGLQDMFTAYLQGNWSQAAASVRDRLPLHPNGTETPFVALGSSRVGLGRDRLRDYGAAHLARTVAEHFSQRHEALRQRGDDRTEKQLVRDTADQAFGGFLAASGLDERGEDRNQIIDALQPASLREALKATYVQTLDAIKETIPPKGARAGDVRRAIRNAVNDRRSHFQTSQLAARADTARDWVDDIQARLTTQTALAVAQHGAPVVAELLRRLATEVKAVGDELQTEAVARRRWAADVDQQIAAALDDAETVLVLTTTSKLDAAVRSAVDTLAWEQEAEIRELAVKLVPDLVANFLDPLTAAVEDAAARLAEDRRGGRDGRASVMSHWPEGGVVPEQLKPAPNEFLLEPTDEFPRILGSLVQRTTGADTVREARAIADRQVLLGTDAEDATGQELVRLEQRWVPVDHLLHRSVAASPTRARFVVAAGASDLLHRATEWVVQPGTTIGSFMRQGLREYLDPDKAPAAEHSDRLRRFEGQLIAALNAGAPLVSINTSVLVQVHDRSEVAYTTSFSEIPLPERSPGRDTFRRVLDARGQWSETIAKAFSDGDAGFVDVFTVLREPYEPVVFDSLMRPIASEWGKRSSAEDTRTEFWRWRRARPLAEALPAAPQTVAAMIRGFFVAGCLQQIDAAGGAVKIFAPNDVGRGGEWLAFPSPLLTATRPSSPDLLPSVLEAMNLAMVQVNEQESLAPMRPYSRLLHLGSGGDHQVPDELAAWVLNGVNPVTDQEAGDWEPRQRNAADRLALLTARFTEHFARIEESSTQLLGYSGAYELRHTILSALRDLERAVRGIEAPTSDGGFF